MAHRRILSRQTAATDEGVVQLREAIHSMATAAPELRGLRILCTSAFHNVPLSEARFAECRGERPDALYPSLTAVIHTSQTQSSEKCLSRFIDISRLRLQRYPCTAARPAL